MLKKLDNLYNNLLFENVEDPWIRQITTDNEFYAEYLSKLISKYQVAIVKSRLNTFRIFGCYANVINALQNFKVDELYWNDTVFGKKFVVYSPLVCFIDNFENQAHKMSYSEGYPAKTVEPNSLYDYNSNITRYSVESRWYDLIDLDKEKKFEFPVRAKYATPTDLIKMINNLLQLQNRNKENTYIILEFVLNCENLANQVYDEETQFIPELQQVDNQQEIKDNINIGLNNKPQTQDLEPEQEVKIPQLNKTNNNFRMGHAVINSYDKKNNYKKVTKEIK